jgi:Cys-tRNA(Pro) deacylase
MKLKIPSTAAVRLLRSKDIEFFPHFYKYEERGGTTVSARELKVPEHSIIKTLVMEDDKKSPIIVLMHGDRQVSTKSLARQTGARAIYSCNPEVANKHSGYLVGGTSPFGTKKTMPVYLERTILDLDEIYINGGSRGFLLSMSPGVLLKLLNPVVVEVGIDG